MVQGSILPGVTRQSIIELARSKGYTVVEAPISVDEAMTAQEIFTSGTAVVVCSVGSLTYKVGHSPLKGTCEFGGDYRMGFMEICHQLLWW
jgi:branched-subunit amino acid aminotransferase/4-amino-4-deoxychorismate lyase